MANSKDKDFGIPQHSIESLARCLFPQIQEYFKSEEGQWEFEKWKDQQVQAGKESE